MAGVFLKILNMSITATWVVLGVILLRLILKKAPKWISCILWSFVAIRLVFPFSFESIFSLIPSSKAIDTSVYNSRPYIDFGIAPIDDRINEYLGSHYFEGVTVPANNTVNFLTVLSIVWIIGIAAMLIYTTISYLRIKNKVEEAALLKDNIWICDNIDTPFILGIVKPRIYLSSTMSETDAEYVIAHEKAHLKRRDHLWKPFGFLLLSLHWFNPFLWVAYVLLCRDIESACDEKVLAENGTEIKKSYSEALINCSVPRKSIAACPLAFGEVGVKERVKNVLHYKKPALWLLIVAVASLIVTSVCLLTNPKEIDISNIGDVDRLHNTTTNSVGMAYGYLFVSEKDTAYLSLVPETKRFFFSFSLLSSYHAMGAYKEYADNIIMKTDDGKYTYTFIKDGVNFIFDAKKSSEMPKYAYSSGASPEVCVPDRAIFQKNDEIKLYIDKITFDIDKDGKDETCVMDYGPTSGLFTFSLKITENGTEEYFNTYNSIADELSFVVKDGVLKVQGVNLGDNPETILFDISFKDGNIVLTNNGKALAYWGKQGVQT